MIRHLHQFRRWAGVDRAVFFSNATQLLRLCTGPVTLALVLRHLTPEIQGYFYAFAGVVALQTFLEMGFSQNILQFAAHEFSKLRFTPSGKIEGDPVALSRLISLGRLAFGYYAVAAAVALLVIGVGGDVFFTVSGQHGVAWRGAWWIIAVTAPLGLAINPAWALLEGCNQVPAVAQYRFWASLTAFAANAAALVLGAGIYVSACVSVVSLLFGVGWLAVFWRPFLVQFLERPAHGEVSWRREIWPFQWRIAVSWASGYFIFDILNPVAFYFCGAVDAGRFGMSLQLVRMVMNVALTWVLTKASRFGMLVAARAWAELDSLWRRSTVQAFVICLLGEISLCAAVPLAGRFWPNLPARLAPVGVTAWLAGNMAVNLLVNAFALELRAHKREPYMWLSVAGAVCTTGFILPLAKFYGIAGEAVGMALAALVLFIPAWQIYRVKRLEFRHDADMLARPNSPP